MTRIVILWLGFFLLSGSYVASAEPMPPKSDILIETVITTDLSMEVDERAADFYFPEFQDLDNRPAHHKCMCTSMFGGRAESMCVDRNNCECMMGLFSCQCECTTPAPFN